MATSRLFGSIINLLLLISELFILEQPNRSTVASNNFIAIFYHQIFRLIIFFLQKFNFLIIDHYIFKGPKCEIPDDSLIVTVLPYLLLTFPKFLLFQYFQKIKGPNINFDCY